jgi:lipopolysaccharide biosynthesis regulator YciM
LRKGHYITLAAAVALLALIYFGANTKPPAPKGDKAPVASETGSAPATMKPASFADVLSAAKEPLAPEAATKVKSLEDELAAISDSSQMAVGFYKLSNFWKDNKNARLAAYYAAQSAKLENSEKKLNFAGQFFLDQLATDTSEAMQMWDVQQATEAFERSLTIDPASDTAKMGLAQCYIVSGEPMKGVGLLREIVAQKPDDVPANMILGKMSVQSGQFDKAIGRFETVLKTEPANTEAMYMLAVSYKETGNKAKAIELLEKCKQIVSNPAFSSDIDKYINSFK